MAPTKKKGWINIYNVLSLDVTGKSIYPTEEAALLQTKDTIVLQQSKLNGKNEN